MTNVLETMPINNLFLIYRYFITNEQPKYFEYYDKNYENYAFGNAKHVFVDTK